MINIFTLLPLLNLSHCSAAGDGSDGDVLWSVHPWNGANTQPLVVALDLKDTHGLVGYHIAGSVRVNMVMRSV